MCEMCARKQYVYDALRNIINVERELAISSDNDHRLRRLCLSNALLPLPHSYRSATLHICMACNVRKTE